MAEAHGRACAQRIEENTRAEGHGFEETAQRIHEHCGVSLLRAHRLARDWTLVQVAEKLREIFRERDDPSSGNFSHQRVSQWENGNDIPTQRHMDALCRLYQTRPDRLGYGHDYTPAAQGASRFAGPGRQVDESAYGDLSARSGPGPDGDEMKRRDLLRTLAAATCAPLSVPVLQALQSVRKGTDSLLETQSVSAATVDYWEEIARDYGRQQLTSTPPEFLARVVPDFLDLRQTLERRQPLDSQRRLYRVLGQLAGLVAVQVNDASEHREAYAWLHTAHLAADESGDRQLRAWIRAKEATWYLWYDRPVQRAVELARAAQSIAGPRPSAAGTLAALVEARAQARFGRRPESLAALHRADAAFEALPPEQVEESMLGVDAHRLQWNKGNALTMLGEVRPAMEAQRLARHLSSIDLALVALDRSACLIRAGEMDQGCSVARQALLSLAPGSRGGLPLYRSRQIIRMIKPADEKRGPVRDLRDVVADWKTLETVTASALCAG